MSTSLRARVDELNTIPRKAVSKKELQLFLPEMKKKSRTTFEGWCWRVILILGVLGMLAVDVILAITLSKIV